MTQPVNLDDLRVRVQAVLDDAHRRHRRDLAPLGADVDSLLAPIELLLTGGKRLRAAFCYWGYRALGGAHSDAIVQVATAMEVFQAAALLHDDVMDNSDTRRGRPTAHVQLAQLHRDNGWEGDPQRFGEAGAILAGDLCLNWTDELYTTSGLPAEELARGRAEFDLMRTQLMAGQYLDVLESVQDWSVLDTDERLRRARRVLRFKSAKYSVEQPLLIGACAAGADSDTRRWLSEFGIAVGEAFQLRDDLLGIFGDPETTGKPAGDDLREGKQTVIVAYALDRSDEEDEQLFEDLFGCDDLTLDGVEALREWCVRTGAVQRTEDLIEQLRAQAHRALAAAKLSDEGTAALLQLAESAIAREA